MVKIKVSNICLLIYIVVLYSCERQKPIDVPDTNISLTDYYPAWSPDGEWIAYYHSDANQDSTGIYLIKPNGSDNKLWHRCFLDSPPVWSPNGEWMAFSEAGQIWKQKFDGDSLIRLTNGGNNHFLSWNPNESLLAYTQTRCTDLECGIWIINFQSDSTYPCIQYGGYPDFHPSEQKLVYSTRWVEESGRVLGDSVLTYDYTLKSKKFLTTLSEPNYSNEHFRYSDSGNRILFMSSSHRDYNLPSLWVMNNDGTNKTKILEDSYAGDWSPNSNKIVYTDCSHNNGELWIFDAISKEKTQLTIK